MIIGIDMGHTVSGSNYGAVGIIKESEETRVLGNKVINLLKGLGHTTINCTVDTATSNTDSLNKRVSKANAQKLDLFVSIHFNASNGKGYGTEVFTYGGKESVQAKRVLNNICALGFTNRGIKDGSHLAVIRGTKYPAMLVETCFIDNQIDVKLYNSNIDNIAKAIVEGITGQKINAASPIKADKNSPNALAMQEQIKLLQGLFNMKQDGTVTQELVTRLPIFKGGESKGSASILQSILIIKGYLSKSNERPPLGRSVKSALDKFKSDNKVPITDELTNKQVWLKLLEY